MVAMVNIVCKKSTPLLKSSLPILGGTYSKKHWRAIIIIINYMPTQTANGQKLYYTAKSLLGKVLAADNASDGYGMYGCAESVNRVATIGLGKPIGGGASTQLMFQALQDTTRFETVTQPLAGDICICPTGTSNLGSQLHGHVGVVGMTWNMSNDSETATWEANYTRQSWEASFAARGFTTHYFRVL